MAHSSNERDFAVIVLPWPTPDLASVISLHAANSQTLGPLPKGAFEEYAQKRQILAAKNTSGDLLGYLLYRVSHHRAAIVHLCIDPAYRGRHLGRLLVNELKQITKPLMGIGLRCRQDNHAKLLWPQMGFSAMGRKPGRGRDGHELTFWWFDHGHPDLIYNRAPEDHRSRVVIDANVFFDLQGGENRKCEDSQVLMADWVQGAIEFCVTKEIHNEIDRAADDKARSMSLAHVTKYFVLPAEDSVFQQICEKLKPLFPLGNRHRDGSDLRQVAYAIAGGASFFVTRDEALADRCDSLYETYGLHVVAPGELIRRLDMLEREEEYRPARVHGSRLQTGLLTPQSVETAAQAFSKSALEKQSEFRRDVLNWIGRPLETDTSIVTDPDGKAVLLTVRNKSTAGTLELPLICSTQHPLAGTVLRSFIRSTLDAATHDNRFVVTVPDSALDESARQALREFSFRLENGAWKKIAKRSMGDFAVFRGILKEAETLGLGPAFADSAQLTIDSAQSSQRREDVVALEDLFWPSKVHTNAAHSYVIPIRAEWAQHFFDEQLTLLC